MDVFQPLGGSQMGGLVGNLRSIDNFFSKMLKIMTYIFSLRRIVIPVRDSDKGSENSDSHLGDGEE